VAEVERFDFHAATSKRPSKVILDVHGAWVRYSDYEQAEKRGAEKERERLREALLGKEVQRRLWEADRDSNWRLLKGLTYADRQRAVIRAAFAALAALEEADRG